MKQFSPEQFLKVVKKEVEDPEFYPSYSSFLFMMEFLQDVETGLFNLNKREDFIENRLKKV